MELLQGVQQLSHKLTQSIVTLGNFDGVHLGHRQMIAYTVQKAREQNTLAVAYTFRPHPQAFLRPETQIALLSTYDEKRNILQNLGIDILIEEPFDRQFAQTDANTFFTDTLLKRLDVQTLVVGYDFAFGRQRTGNLDALKTSCLNTQVQLKVIEAFHVHGEIVSSSKIRQFLLKGALLEANQLLGSCFSYSGKVIHGAGRGRQLGFPTANLNLEPKLTLPNGVYATLVQDTHKTYPSVTNIGVRPTFHDSESAICVETHLLDQTEDLYGKTLKVFFKQKLRDERKFNGIESLKAQIALDILNARHILARLS